MKDHDSEGTRHIDLATRLPHRAGAFEDHGSLFSKSKMSGKKTTRIRNGISDIGVNLGSDDEMDCLSQKSQGDKESVVEIKKAKKNSSDYDPEAIATKFRAAHMHSFKKTKTEVREEKISSSSPSLSPMKPGPKYHRGKCFEGYTGGNNHIPFSSNKMRLGPQSQPRPMAQLSTGQVDNSSCPKPMSVTNQPVWTPSQIPLPSPISKITTGSSRPSSPASSIILTSRSSSDDSIVSPSSHNPYSSPSTIRPSRCGSRVQQSFPPLSPLSSQMHKPSKVATKNVPIISSEKDKNTRKFPALSPLPTNKVKPALKSSKGKKKVDVLTPFPMSTRDLGGISPSEGESTDPARKRKLEIVDEASAMVNSMDLYEEQDSLFMSPSVDPSNLCPYCDSPLPPSPTRFFLNLLRSTLSKSYSDPRSTNPLGRKAPLATFVAVCQRHDFESKVLPEAEAKGWPKTINWEGLGVRVLRMKSYLERIIRDSGETDLHFWIEGKKCGKDLISTFAFKGPRIQCVFWREEMKSFIKDGARAMVDVRGQFQNFKKSQPGYYGELGHIIIQQTLFNMFPPESFDLKLIKPFSANDFIQRVLVPEVALRLIMEDRGLKGLVGAKAALLILRESTTYGVTMFPEDSGENLSASRGRKCDKTSAIEAGDKIVMERAMKRRKEIESGKVEALSEDVKEGRATNEKKGKGMKRAIRDAGNNPSQNLELEGQELPRRPSRKFSGTDDDDDVVVVSISSKTGSDSVNSGCTDGMETISRHTKRIEYGKDLDYKYSRIQYLGRSLSKSGNGTLSRTQNESSVQSESIRHESMGEVAGSKVNPLEISDLDLCLPDGEYQETYKSQALKKTFQQSRDKLEAQYSNVNPDLITLLPEYHSAGGCEEDGQFTPRPMPAISWSKQQSELALARARAPTAGSTSRETGKPKKLKKTNRSEWYHNMRASVLHMSSSSSTDSDSSIQEMEKGEGTITSENFSWLLDDPSS